MTAGQRRASSRAGPSTRAGTPSTSSRSKHPTQHGTLRRHEREVIDHGEAAAVLTVDRRRGVAILVRQWRGPLVAIGADPYLLEACAGIVDPGETPDEAARREANEETGLEIGELRKIGTILTSAGTLTERMHLYIAEVSAEDRRTNGGGNPHEGEDIEVVEMPLVELFDMASAARSRTPRRWSSCSG